MSGNAKILSNATLSNQKRQFLDGLVLFILLIILVFSFALLVSGLSLVFYGTVQPTKPIIIGVVVFFLALAFLPLRIALSKMLYLLFQKGEGNYSDHIQRYSDEIDQLIKNEDILRTLRKHIGPTLFPKTLHLYYYDTLHEQYVASTGQNGIMTSDLRFSSNNPIIKMLVERQGPIFLNGSVYEKRILQTDRTRLNLLGAEMVYPILGTERLLGWIGFGARENEQVYHSLDLKYIDLMCKLAARAMERTQIISSLEERVKHLNVLTRISQGINITLNLDDILELIYAQTIQLIPATDLSIIVLERTNQRYNQVFCVINDERLVERENKIIDLEDLLEQVVIEKQQPLMTNHYQRECLKRNITPQTNDLSAWLSVPLLSGAEIIGALSIGRRDIDGVYTQPQLDLLEAIADQVAGALEKSRLLTETEKRAQQLSSLNEISRKLTSNLDFDSLLRNILQNAVQILQCEAGALFLVDENTDELIFNVIVGLEKEQLIGKRIPLESGLVGKAVVSGNPVRVNEVNQSSEFYHQAEGDTSYPIRSAMVVPLVVKNKVIGVIEILNKMDQSLFSMDDEELLAAFAAQASISIENARMYTLTDQQLEARIEELSVLQKVGRELNATLDLGQAMEITLKWAISKSMAQAGFVAMKEDNKFKVIASSGYGEDLEIDENGYLISSIEDISAMFQTGQTQTIRFDSSHRLGILNNALQQVLLPIERENICTGLVLLETNSETEITAEEITFLQRMIDHASISIANAQLYSAVQNANIAKSEFVSFVSHELKNPMTSIKGYTELLAAGAVGPVNEAQNNFLMTIRSNVDRMATLVSDLADESRIEAGKLRLDFEAISLKKIIDEVIRSEGRLIEEKNLSLSIEMDDPLPLVWADHTRLLQIFTNLISNARKYTPEGGNLKVRGEESLNHWDHEGAKKVIHISIEDNGLGISPQDQEKIFQKFFRSDDEKMREVPGTGLGLNITRSLVEAQGGKIWFKSEYRRGTAFHFTIPQAENMGQ